MSLVFCSFFLEFGARLYAKFIHPERTATYDRILRWKLLPRVKKQYSQEEKPYLIETNSKGLRDKEYSYEKPENRYRVVILGDSFVFGSGGVNSSHCFTQIMEAHLKNVDVINMGIPAFSLDQEYLYLEKVIDLMDPMMQAGFQHSLYFETDIHLSSSGHQFVADCLIEYLVKNTALNEDHK